MEHVAQHWTMWYAGSMLSSSPGFVGNSVIDDREARASLELDVVALTRRKQGSVLAIGEAKSGAARRLSLRQLGKIERARELLAEAGHPEARSALLLLFGATASWTPSGEEPDSGATSSWCRWSVSTGSGDREKDRGPPAQRRTLRT